MAILGEERERDTSLVLATVHIPHSHRASTSISQGTPAPGQSDLRFSKANPIHQRSHNYIHIPPTIIPRNTSQVLSQARAPTQHIKMRTTTPLPLPLLLLLLLLLLTALSSATSPTTGATPTAAAATTSPTTPAAAGPSAPDSAAVVTGAEGAAAAENGRFVQTTYWACVTRGTYSHCGWHRPILDASGAAAAGGGRGAGVGARAGVVAAVAVVAGLVGLLG